MPPPRTTVLQVNRLTLRLMAFCFVLICAANLYAQKQSSPAGTTAGPVVDSSAQASPAAAPPAAPSTDAAKEASPAPPPMHEPALPSNTAISIRVLQAADSAHVKNGDMLRATLAAPMRTGKRSLPAGTRVGLTVVSVAAAGKLQSRGEMSLQVVSVAGVPVFSETITLRGKIGHKDLPDSAPQKGTEATVAANTTMRFRIPPEPKQ